ncbi:MAG: hypothetical protein LBJ62_08735 [Bifidobacteriaceae bacterium]|jgi:hypothetical protein|nr:hypothetical protein [Bifidobacteriaceae bacterium]
MNPVRRVALGVALLVSLTGCTGQVPVDGSPSTGIAVSAAPSVPVELPKAQTESPSPVELPFAHYYEAARCVAAVAAP